MQEGDPSWVGYVYAFLIFVGVVSITILALTFNFFFFVLKPLKSYSVDIDFQTLGVLCEAQYYQNVWRVGFRLRSTLVKFVKLPSLSQLYDNVSHV